MKLKLKARAFQRCRGSIRSSTISAVTLQETIKGDFLHKKNQPPAADHSYYDVTMSLILNFIWTTVYRSRA